MKYKFIKSIVFTLIIVGLLGCSSPEEKAAEYISNGDLLFDSDNLVKAEIEYKNALQINQNLPNAWYGLARIHERKQQWKQVIGALTRIRESHPNHVNGRIMLAKVLLASNQIDQALEDSKDILELAPDEARTHALAAAVQFKLGNLETAGQSVQRALDIDSRNDEAILVKARILMADKKFDEALSVLDEALRVTPETASFYLMKVQIYTELDDASSIGEVYRVLILNFPENIAFKQALISRYIEADNIDQAEKLFEEIVRDNPTNERHKIRLASFKSKYRSVDDAIVLIESFINQNPENYRFRFALGEIYERQNRNDESMAVYLAIVNDDGVQANGLEARNRLALIHLRAGRRGDAEILVDEVLANDSRNEQALLLRAEFRFAEKKYDDAIILLRTMLRDNPASIDGLYLLGQSYASLGSLELAIQAYTEAFRQQPENPKIADELVTIYIRSGRAQQADDVLKRSINSGNQSLQALKLLTQVKLMLADWDMAEKLAKQLRTVEGEEVTAQQALGLVYEGKNEQAESLNAFLRAYELDPDSLDALTSLIRAFVRNDKVAEAKQILLAKIDEDENHAAAYQLLGRLSLREGDHESAIGYFERIVETNPKLEIGYLALAGVYQRENRLEQAEGTLQDGLRNLPDNVVLKINLALIYLERDAIEKSIASFEELVENRPDLIVAKNNLASLLSDHRDDKPSLERAMQLASEFKSSSLPGFRDTYSWASIRAGKNLQEAIAILEAVVRENDWVGVYNYHLGEGYRKNGELEKAAQFLNKAVELEVPDSIIAKKAQLSLQEINK